MNVDVCVLHLFSDPDEQELERMMIVGQRVTWPKVRPILLTRLSAHILTRSLRICFLKLHLIENRTRLEREIYKGRKALRQPAAPTQRISAPDVDVSADAGPSTNEILSPGDPDKKFDLTEPQILHTRAQTFPGGAWDSDPRDGDVRNKLLALGDEPIEGDEQLPVDSEAERGFATGSQKFFKRPHQHHLSRDVAARLRGDQDLRLRDDDSSLRRRRSGVISPGQHVNSMPPTSNFSPPIQAPTPRPGHLRTPSFMERFRKSPLSALSSLRSRSPAVPRNTVRDDDGWSESSSSSEEEWAGGMSPAVSLRRGRELHDEDA